MQGFLSNIRIIYESEEKRMKLVKTFVTVAVAAACITGVSAHRGYSEKCVDNASHIHWTDTNGDGICDNFDCNHFVDEDKDGICDHHDGMYFVDENGDGICDHQQNENYMHYHINNRKVKHHKNR